MNLMFNNKKIMNRINEILYLLSNRRFDDKYYKLYLELCGLNSIQKVTNNFGCNIDYFFGFEHSLFINSKYNQSVKNFIDYTINNKEALQFRVTEIINLLVENGFHQHSYQTNKIELSISIDLVKSFLKMFNLEQFEYFNHLIITHRIGIVNKKIDQWCGVSFILNNKPYILSYNENNLNTAITLVHEFSHVYDIYKGYIRPFDYDNLFIEVRPHYMENLFCEFLINNKIYIDDALNMQNDNYYYLYKTLLQMLAISSLDKISYNQYGNVTNSPNEIKESLKKSGRIIDDETLELITRNLNVKDSLIYGFGNLLGLNFFDESKKDPTKIDEIFKELKTNNNLLEYLHGKNNFEKSLVLNKQRNIK